MPKQGYADEELISLFTSVGAKETAKVLGTTERNIYARRNKIEERHGIVVNAPSTPPAKTYPHRAALDIRNGVVVIGSDFHIWPGAESTALRAFKKFVDDIRPAAVILNGDVMDFPQISRHPPIGWEGIPTVKEELEAAQDHLQDIAKGARRARKIWTLGNHDARFEMRLAAVAGEYRGIHGIHLSDHFGLYEKAMSCIVNETIEGGATMVKHRFKGGQNAPRANVLNAGISMVTGHLHSQKVAPLSNYRPFDLYGVDTGCVADKDHKAFLYTEDAPLDWRSGFAVLTYRDGRLLMPELVSKWSEKEVQFRGTTQKV